MLLVFYRKSKEVKAHYRYKYIHSRKNNWPVKIMCHVLEVSESGYYEFEENLGKPDRDTFLSAEFQKVLDESMFNDNYGVPRMKIALFNNGIQFGTRRLTRLMRQLGLIHECNRQLKGLAKATPKI